ncbi:MAG TPA: UPF0182 family protein [Candidatus Binataceae bacterium]|nr:UPF0182 family protein [Candidatus Binataceae bacterium]
MIRSRRLLIALAAILLLVLFVLSFGDGLIVDLLWFREIGYEQIFTTTLVAQLIIFAVVWVVAFLTMGGSGLMALRSSRERDRLHVVRRGGEVTEVNLPELVRALGDRVPWRTLILIAAAVLSFFVAQGEAGSWDVYLKGLYGVPFGIIEPAFKRDVGFYVFTMPLLEELSSLLLAIVVLTAIVTIAVYWLRGALDLRESPPQISRSCAAHLSILLAAFFIQRAWANWIARYALTLHSNGIVSGVRYVDVILWKPGLWVLVILAIVAAGICLANVRDGSLRLPVAAALVLFIPSIVLNFLSPVVERLWVKPDELRVEMPYLKRNIMMTRQAYQIDSFDVRQFQGTGHLTEASLQEDSATIKNIRLWDPRPLRATYQQLQEIRLYYNFVRDPDIDRYWLNGKENEVMLSAREMNVDLLPPNAQTWVNRHLKFLHGYGLVMSPVNTKDQEGLPILYIKDIPPVSDIPLPVTRPAIYFGEASDVYGIVDARTPEFDYPHGNDNVYGYYKGGAGVAADSLWRRVLLSIYFRDINLLITDNIVPGSKIIFRRNISQRLQEIAPFLDKDPDPYLVVHDGGLSWIIDTYTTSDHYPYSQRPSNWLPINYIRNPVKVVIDAYTGAVTFYVVDPTDPIIQTWERIYPGVFKPLSAMPPDLRLHIRYPEEFFLIQAGIYATYHMTDPTVFYNREDVWAFPRETYEDQTQPMQPYYVIMRLPGEKNAEYLLMMPMVPAGRDNMIAWLAARCDGADYGHLFEFQFSKARLFYGPYQIQARINQNPEISQQYSLWNQMGSKVLLGNLLVIPTEGSLLYVEPLYIRAQNGQLPELQRVLAAYSDRVVMGTDLDSTLAALFRGGGAPPTVTETAAEAPTPGKPVVVSNAAPKDFGAAAEHYNQALEALKSGDWTRFGAEMQLLGQELGHPGATANP